MFPWLDCTTDEQPTTEESMNFSTESVEATTLPLIAPTTQVVQSDLDDIEDFTRVIPNDGDDEKTVTTETTEFMDFETTTASQRSARRKRHANYNGGNSVDNNAYTMEVMVAVDRKMQEYHKQNIKAYVLTLMSIVSSIYADASIGNSINVAVVHILLLQDDLHVESNPAGKYILIKMPNLPLNTD